MKEVIVDTYEDDGCWWARIVERSPPKRPDWPGSSKCILWSAKTRADALKKASDFLARAAIEVDIALSRLATTERDPDCPAHDTRCTTEQCSAHSPKLRIL